MEYVGNLSNLNYVKYENRLIYFNVNNVQIKLIFELKFNLKMQNEGETLQNVSIVRR